MKIQVLGSGCSSCHKLFEETKKAVKESSINEEVEYIDDVQRAIEMGVMSFPVLAIDGKPVIAGRVPSVDEIKEAIINYKKETDKPREISSGCSCGGKC